MTSLPLTLPPTPAPAEPEPGAELENAKSERPRASAACCCRDPVGASFPGVMRMEVISGSPTNPLIQAAQLERVATFSKMGLRVPGGSCHAVGAGISSWACRNSMKQAGGVRADKRQGGSPLELLANGPGIASIATDAGAISLSFQGRPRMSKALASKA